MSVELLQTLSTVFFVLAGVLFVVAAVLFFYLDVIHLIGDVSGSTARKAIEDIRKGNEISGDKAYKSSPVNKARGKLTDKISPSGQLLHKTGGLNVATGTEKLDSQASSTTVLDDGIGATTLLSDATTETTVLSQTGGETTVLSAVPEAAPVVSAVEYTNNYGNFSLDLEMGFIGSAELIE